MFNNKKITTSPKQIISLSIVLVCGIGVDANADTVSSVGAAQEAVSQGEIAKKLNNPIAAMSSLPFQYNKDKNIGLTDLGERSLLNIQPVVPFTLNEEWNLISRTIVPIIDQTDIPPGVDENGLGDVVQSFFFSPQEPTSSGWVWGVGPVFLLPPASEDTLGAEKWGVGPTAVALKQANGWTYGALANHLWSVAGDDDRADVNATFMQPFLAYTLPTYTTLSLNTESTYDWRAEQWSVPVNLAVTQLFKVGNQPMSLQLGARYWADSPDSGAEDWGIRIAYTLVFLK
jgi:hypothetical protein